MNLATDLRQSQRDAGPSGTFEAGKAGRTGSHNTTDAAHWPSVGWSMYLTDGEFADLESQIFSGHAQWINADPGRVLRNGSDRAFGPVGQTRALAWGLREILHAELITPDNHPLKSAQQHLVERALVSMTNAVTRRSPAHDGNVQGWDMGLFLWCCGTSSVEYDAANMAAGFSGGNVGTAFWQQAWLQWAIMLYSLHGWHDEASILSDWAIPGLIDRFGYDLETDGYCWNRAVAYKVGVRYTSSSDFFANMAEIFAANWPEISECAPYGASMFDDTSQTTRAHAVAPGLAVAVALAWPGASMAADYYLNRDYDYSWNDLPQWGIQPWQ